MQPQMGSPQHIRSSYGYSIQDSFVSRNQGSKGFPGAVPKQHPTTPQDLGAAIRNLEQSGDLSDSPGRKHFFGGGSPVLNGQVGIVSGAESKFRPVFPPNAEKTEGSGQEFLRGSCSNVLRKFESSTNLGCSLRNTTRFNVVTKMPLKGPEPKKTTEEQPHTNPKEGNVPAFLRAEERMRASQEGMSRTPTKTGLDASTKLSRTPVKYKNVFQNNSNKNSGISKVSTETEDKKQFTSLSEIVATKAKEKMIQQTSKSPHKRSRMLREFEIGSVLGKGKFGEVFLARHQQAGFMVAIKKVVKSKVKQFKMVDQFCNQIRLHSCLDHPNIVRFYGCFQEGPDIHLVMEYMNGGTLFDYLNEVNTLSLRQTVEYLRDIIEALIYMHEKSIAHRDIKPENIVISSEGVAKLCDFGWAALVQTSRKTYCGTFDYAPPQILERKNYDTSVDIWCIGVLTYELLTGRVPFEGEQRNIVMQKILNVDKAKIDYPVEIVPEAKEFIEALVQKDPNLRPRSHDLLKFKLFSLFPTKMGKSGSSKK